MKLEQALSILSKSSPYAVSTEREEGVDPLKTYKDYLYIKTDIESAFLKALKSVNPKDILFLCGSSGDGKSEILTRYSSEYKSRADFHLDATHSFSPSQTAIQALDELFDSYKESQRPLVVGINVGMLGNYAVEGAERHLDIKESISAFLKRKKDQIPSHHTYLDFEQFPKFILSTEGNTSEFVAQLVSRLTDPTLDNPFYALYSNEVERSGHSTLTANFALLGLESVQNNVISLLLNARLIKDQFLTARALLDFVYQILAMDGYLFDNLFSGADNELLEHIQSFDPSNLHTRIIDEFTLQFGLGIEDEGFTNFQSQVEKYGVYGISESSSYLRLVYLLKDEPTLMNEFITEIKDEFDSLLVEQYAAIWLLHKELASATNLRPKLNRFYRDILISAIHRYCNRNAPALEKDVYFISEYNGFKTAVELEVKADFDAIKENGVVKIGSFNAHIQIEGKPIKSIPISINLLELLQKINQGYRPNKHDKNAILLLDEVVDQIIAVANDKDTMFILKEDKRYKISNDYDEYFEVSGI